MVTVNIDKLEAAAKAATPIRIHEFDEADSFGVKWYRLCSTDEISADFATDARDVVLSLIAEVRRLRVDLRCAEIQVEDRGQSFADAKSEIAKLKASVVEMADMVKSYWPIEDDRKRADMLRQLAVDAHDKEQGR